MWSIVIICYSFISFTIEGCASYGNIGSSVPPRVKSLNVEDVIKKDHLHEDLKDIIRLEKAGELSEGEALFYFLTFHDFDGNGKLDGLELMTATRHAAQHDDIDENLLTQADLIDTADGFLSFDADFDGFLTYTELRRTINVVQKHQKEL